MDEKFEEPGWVLPLDYYKEALSRLPGDLFYIIVTDTTDIAEDAFSFLYNKYISRNNPAVVGMFLFTHCKFNIIANSSFSWWGAWLNQMPDKIIYAPKFHLGWPIQVWCPSGIKVNEWNYIDVLPALENHSATVLEPTVCCNITHVRQALMKLFRKLLVPMSGNHVAQNLLRKNIKFQ